MDTSTWETLPAAVRDVIQAPDRCGQVIKAEPLAKGPAPGLTAVLHNADGGRHVLKAAPQDSPAAHLYLSETAANAALPPALPAPPMTYAAVTGGWILMLFAYLPDAEPADLSPGSPDLPGVLAAVDAISATEAKESLPPVTQHAARLQASAARLTATLPPGDLADLYAAALDGFDPGSLDGARLVHYDLHAPNLLMSGGNVHVIDWAFASAGAGGLDAVLLLPRLVAAGHEPAAALAAIADLPGWRDLPVTAVIGLWTMFRHNKALWGPPEHRGRYVPSITAGQRLLRHWHPRPRS